MTSTRPMTFVALVLVSACTATPVGPPTTTSGIIGPSGGVLSLGDSVTLGIPPGALGADQTLTITRTDEAAPVGYVAYSPIYRFEPRGIVFEAPVTVTIAFAGDGSRASIIWTNIGETGWETAAGSVAGGHVSAQIVHFSRGFVGGLDIDTGGVELDASSDDAGTDPSDADVDDASPWDVGVVDAEVTDGDFVDAFDASSSDAGAAYCPLAVPLPTGTTTTGLTWEVTDPTIVDPCLAGCPTSIPDGMRSAAVVTLTEPMQVTMWWWHNLAASSEWRAGISGDCRAPGAVCVTDPAIGYPRMSSNLLGPGTYQFVSCTRSPSVIIEPPPPPPTNTSCATAGYLPYTQGRVTTGGPLYYVFDWGGMGTASIAVASAMNQGQMHLSLRTACDPTTQVASYDAPYVLSGTIGTIAFPMAGRPAGRYYIVATEVSPGLEYAVRFY